MTPLRPRRRTGLRGAALAVALGVSVVVLHGSSAVFWRVSTHEEFLAGAADGVSIDADGRLTLARDAELLHEATAPFLWSLAPAGGALWIGSGGNGRVFRLEPDGGASTIFEAAEQNIHVVHPDDAGAALVGTSPDGALFRIGRGPAERIFDPDDRYIWAVAADPAGNRFVATGDEGRIYRLAPNGETSLFYEADASHVLALSRDTEGNLLAGTGTPGQVLRIGGDGRGFVVLDSPYAEIRALHVAGDGTLYAVAVGESAQRSTPPAPPPPAAASPGVPRVTTSTTVTVVGVADSGRAPAPGAGPAQTSGATAAGRGAVYRIGADGAWDTVWESARDTPYDVSTDGRGGLLIGTGPDGRIYHVSADPPRVRLLARAPARQVTRFAAGAGGAVYYATANPGKVYRLLPGQAGEGTYVSEVRDARTVARWGALRWHALTPGDSSVRLYTRSGNTSTPNDAWSRWSAAYRDANGSSIGSPRARYLQWKAELRGEDDSPTLLSVTAAYLPQNLRPEIATLTVHEPGVAFQQPFASGDPPIAGLDDRPAASGGNGAGGTQRETQQTTLGRRVHRRGLRTFVWTARDPNNDRLRFDLLVRTETDTSWRALRTGIEGSIYTWDTTSVPDGSYLVRLIASDAGANAPGAGLVGVTESKPFDVDNSPPRIDIDAPRREAGRFTVAFAVIDGHSPVRRVEYSLDTARWEVLYPLDGIADSTVERFRLAVDRDQLDRLAIRATDALGNAVTAAAPAYGATGSSRSSAPSASSVSR